MEITDKKAFKKELREKIMEYMRKFPFYFYGNIVINIILIVLLAGIVFIFLASFFNLPSALPGYGFIAIGIILRILSVTFGNFLKNIRIISSVRNNDYELEIEEYELDHILELIEKLPMEEDEIKRMKVELSYGKLIDILDLIGIINNEDGVYDVNTEIKARMMEKAKLSEEKIMPRRKNKFRFMLE
jgi:hypothetical protein